MAGIRHHAQGHGDVDRKFFLGKSGRKSPLNAATFWDFVGGFGHPPDWGPLRRGFMPPGRNQFYFMRFFGWGVRTPPMW